jgi:hypothetical protein
MLRENIWYFQHILLLLRYVPNMVDRRSAYRFEHLALAQKMLDSKVREHLMHRLAALNSMYPSSYPLIDVVHSKHSS